MRRMKSTKSSDFHVRFLVGQLHFHCFVHGGNEVIVEIFSSSSATKTLTLNKIVEFVVLK